MNPKNTPPASAGLPPSELVTSMLTGIYELVDEARRFGACLATLQEHEVANLTELRASLLMASVKLRALQAQLDSHSSQSATVAPSVATTFAVEHWIAGHWGCVTGGLTQLEAKRQACVAAIQCGARVSVAEYPSEDAEYPNEEGVSTMGREEIPLVSPTMRRALTVPSLWPIERLEGTLSDELQTAITVGYLYKETVGNGWVRIGLIKDRVR